MNPSSKILVINRSHLTDMQVETPMPVSVVIPCYNESESLFHLAECLAEMRSDFESEFDFQFVFVDDGSSDETNDLLHDHFAGWNNVLILRHGEN